MTMTFAIISLLLKDYIIKYNSESYVENTVPYLSICGLTGEITESTVIRQTFETNLDEIEGIYLRTATYMRDNDSDLKFTFYSDDQIIQGGVFVR